jgi:hypothetical protein
MKLVAHNDSLPVVLFATCSLSPEVSVDYLNSMLSTQTECTKAGIPWGHRIRVGLQFTDLARNELVDYFLKSPEGFTQLFFIDADQGWDPQAILRMVMAGKDVVSALPPKKCDPPTFHDNAITGKIEDGLFEALEAGTGCMRIKRTVFSRMDSAFPELAQGIGTPFGWPHTPYFQTGMGKYGWNGEDMFFCHQLTSMGEHVWIDSDVTFTHRGSKAWKGNFYDHCVAKGLLKRSA